MRTYEIVVKTPAISGVEEGPCECRDKDDHGICLDCGQGWHKIADGDGAAWERNKVD